MASIGPIGGAIYANQNMAAVASEQTSLQNRFELQSLAAAAIQRDKDKAIQETKPAEETYKIDPENEHQQQTADEELSEQAKEAHPAQPAEKEHKPSKIHILDIKV